MDMILLAVMLLSLVVEGAAVIFSAQKKFRRPAAACAIIVISFSAGFVITTWFNIFSLLYLVAAVYRVINMLRILKGRIPVLALRKKVVRSYILLAVTSFLLAVPLYFAINIPINPTVTGIGFVQFLGAVVLLGLVNAHLRKYHSHANGNHIRLDDLPTVTVAIPARNEVPMLEACLKSILASTYPKLEILVVDDCSQDKTAEIIRSFAHKGIRFIKGTTPPEEWLPRNHAYQLLAQEATGEYIVFCSADVRLPTDAIETLIQHAHSHKIAMLSMLPKRIATQSSKSIFPLRTLRYWGDIIAPFTKHRVPVASSLWLIHKKALKRRGFFKGVSKALNPEFFFARELHKSNEYHFLVPDEKLHIDIVSSNADDVEAAIRSRYPQAHRSVADTFFISFVVLFLLVLPPFLLVYGVLIGLSWLSLPFLAAYVSVAVVDARLLRLRGMPLWYIRPLMLPLVALSELGLINRSMWEYEFGTVDWKGRNICLPVLEAIPKLPSID